MVRLVASILVWLAFSGSAFALSERFLVTFSRAGDASKVEIIHGRDKAETAYRAAMKDENRSISIYSLIGDFDAANYLLVTEPRWDRGLVSWEFTNRIDELKKLYSEGYFATGCTGAPENGNTVLLEHVEASSRPHKFNQYVTVRYKIHEWKRKRTLPYLLCGIQHPSGLSFESNWRGMKGHALVRAGTLKDFERRTKRLKAKGYRLQNVMGAGRWIGTYVKRKSNPLGGYSYREVVKDAVELRALLDEMKRRELYPAMAARGYTSYLSVTGTGDIGVTITSR